MKRLSSVLAVVAILSSCASTSRFEKRDATRDLLYHPEFQAASKAAPKWVSEAMATITRYEAELESRK